MVIPMRIPVLVNRNEGYSEVSINIGVYARQPLILGTLLRVQVGVS